MRKKPTRGRKITKPAILTRQADFNHAVDILMQGPVEIKSDERLQQEFDKIEETKVEMVAFKEGDGFAEQQPEPAPLI